MKELYEEILRRFPEVASFVCEGDEELPYLMVGHVANWLKTVAKPHFKRDVIQRVVGFHRWCTSQPQGTSAKDDVATILSVGFIEKVLEHDELLPLVPHLFTKDDVLRNRNHWTTWVGAERYQATVRAFDV